MVKVVLARPGNRIIETVEEMIEQLGGIGRFVHKGDLVLIKPNMFIHAQPETGEISHPKVVLAVAKLCYEQGAEVVIGERTKNIFLNFRDYPEIWDYARIISFDDAPLKLKRISGAKSFYMPVAIPSIVDDCDVFINIPGLRTHSLTNISNGLKNMMGIFPSDTTRFIHHFGLWDCIVDLNLARPSDLVITDAIYSIQGNFPTGGKPLYSNLLMVSDNVVASDAVAARLIGFEPQDVDHIREAYVRGIGPIDESEMEIMGVKLREVQLHFEHAPGSYEDYRRELHIIDPVVCKGCRQALSGGLKAAVDEVGLEAIKHIQIVTGPVEKPVIGPGPVLLYGNCTKCHKNLGLYVDGCPPLAGQAKAALLQLAK